MNKIELIKAEKDGLKIKNDIIIKFKGRWKNKFGHIKLLKNKNIN